MVIIWTCNTAARRCRTCSTADHRRAWIWTSHDVADEDPTQSRFRFKTIVSQVVSASTFCAHFLSLLSWPLAQSKHLDLSILKILCVNHFIKNVQYFDCRKISCVFNYVLSQFFSNNVDVTHLFHWTTHITALSFLVASGDIKVVHTQCNTTPMNANINPSKHSGCCTPHLFSHQKLFILATSRFYGFSVGGLRLSKWCSWEHRSSSITVVRRREEFWDHAVVGPCIIAAWRWGHCAVSKWWATNTRWRREILQKYWV